MIEKNFNRDLNQPNVKDLGRCCTGKEMHRGRKCMGKEMHWEGNARGKEMHGEGNAWGRKWTGKEMHSHPFIQILGAASAFPAGTGPWGHGGGATGRYPGLVVA